MKSLSLAVAALLAGSAQAYWKGVNVGANNPDGSCKSRQDWVNAFNDIKGFPGGYTAIRTFATSDCNTLANAVPAAIETGGKILVGVWATDDGHFDREKGALYAAIQRYGHDWMIAISVGNEDLYRKDIDPNVLAQRIYDVRGMVRSQGVPHEVGHSDTFSGWTDPNNKAVIRAVDFVGHQGYPYWQSVSVEDGPNVFWTGFQRTKAAVDAVKPGTWVWITEGGWPISGTTLGAAVASVPNSARYYKEVACEAYRRGHVFWYAYQEPHRTPDFSMVGTDRKPLYDLTC